MEIILAGTGGYPRIGDSLEKQMLRRAIAEWERGIIDETRLKEIENSVVREVIDEQIHAGLELVTDGLVRWYCPFSHSTAKLQGIKINGLLRYFDTNFYFRQPIAIDKVKRIKPLLVDDYVFAHSVSSKPVKVVMTGAYTLSRHTIIEYPEYNEIDHLIEDYSIALSEEVHQLVAAGAEFIQIDEPAILKHPEDFPLLKESINIIRSTNSKATLALYTYFGDARPLYDRFQSLDVDILGFDFNYCPDLIDDICKQGSDKILGLGLIDGRNTKIEIPEIVVRTLTKITSAVHKEMFFLNPNCGLELLPRDKAFLKLVNMKKTRNLFQ